MPLIRIAALGLALGCAGDASTDRTPTDPTVPCGVESLGQGPVLQYGVGEDFFEPIDDGDPILVVFGPQGGYHLDASIRVQGVDPGDPENVDDPRNPRIGFEARLADGSLVSGIPKKGDDGIIRIQQGLPSTCRDGVFEIGGRRIFLVQNDVELDGEALTVTATIEDADGVVLTDTVEVIAEPSPFN